MQLDEKTIFYGAIVFTVAEYVWELYLDIRQLKVVQKSKTVPSELASVISQNKFDKCRAYDIDKLKFGMVADAFSFALNLLFMIYYGLYIFWNVGGSIISHLGFQESELLHNVAFSVTLNVVKVITDLPFTLYSTFVLEEKYGFNNETVSFFICDKLKMHILQQVITVILVCGITYLNIGDYFFIYLWIFVLVMSVFLYAVYPEYIAPLFDKFTPLPEGELRTEIEKMAQSVNFPLTKLYVVEGSKRSAHSNAYFYGMFKKKRIVLFDTLLKDYSPENAKKPDGGEKKGCDTKEVVAVLVHELAHWKYSHSIKQFAFMQVTLLVMFTAYGMLFNYQPIYGAFGFHDCQPMLVGLFIVSVVICLPFFSLMRFVAAAMSRHFEYQADSFAKSMRTTEHLKMALVKLYTDNLAFPIDDPLYSAWHNSHPSLLERLQALDKSE